MAIILSHHLVLSLSGHLHVGLAMPTVVSLSLPRPIIGRATGVTPPLKSWAQIIFDQRCFIELKR